MLALISSCSALAIAEAAAPIFCSNCSRFNELVAIPCSTERSTSPLLSKELLAPSIDPDRLIKTLAASMPLTAKKSNLSWFPTKTCNPVTTSSVIPLRVKNSLLAFSSSSVILTIPNSLITLKIPSIFLSGIPQSINNFLDSITLSFKDNKKSWKLFWASSVCMATVISIPEIVVTACFNPSICGIALSKLKFLLTVSAV